MIIKTKKYQLAKNTYIKIALVNALKKQWWAFLIALGICAFTFVSYWFLALGILGAVLFVAFWAIQFAGITQVDQYKVLFDKYTYEIDGRQILIKMNDKQGMQMKWENIQTVDKTKEAYILYVSKGQFVYLPFKIFNSDNDINFFEALLKRKSLVKE
jgi:hypothetical protein